MSTHLAAGKLLVTDEGVSLCTAGPTRYAPDDESVNRTQVVLYQIQALAQMLEDDETSTEDFLMKAVELEAEVGYDPGPPFIAYPSYGDWLLTQQRFDEAIVQFDKSLEQRTNRTKALRGKLSALKSMNRMEEAAEVESLLQRIGASST